jgi:pyruvate,orthophosphate dikinase
VDYQAKQMTVGGESLKEGDFLSIDGTVGEVYPGELKTAPSEVIQVLVAKTLQPKDSRTYQYYSQLMKWCDKATRMSVRTNADSPVQAANAIAFGATGIGLCRTEHMFFEGDRIDAMREMILADNLPDRKKALAKLLPYQRADFIGIFTELNGYPATIRFLDPPLHEFLPHTQAEIEEVARAMNTDPRRLADRVRELAEFNPMLGFRGCRLAIAYPEIAEMQSRAIFEAAVEAGKRTGKAVGLEVMVPLIATKAEFDLVKTRIDLTAQAVMKETGAKLNYQVGTMIELPRACLMAGDIAKTAEFFSFGTNDLTQTTYGISRDDAASFLSTYVSKGILEIDPFISVDREGVGELVKIGVARGRKTRPSLKVGICGEHGGDPASVAFCHQIGLDYVSCSPYRVPIARLAAAQAALGKAAASQA